MISEAQTNALKNAYKEWSYLWAENDKVIDFRTWLEVKHGVKISRYWKSIRFVSSEKELMFMLRWS